MQGTVSSTVRSVVTSDWINDVWLQSAPAIPAPGPVERLAEPRVRPDLALVELPAEPEDCCNGHWCRQCRDDIRQEAFRWIRELNAAPAPEKPRPVETSWYRTWHSELLLGNT